MCESIQHQSLRNKPFRGCRYEENKVPGCLNFIISSYGFFPEEHNWEEEERNNPGVSTSPPRASLCCVRDLCLFIWSAISLSCYSCSFARQAGCVFMLLMLLKKGESKGVCNNKKRIYTRAKKSQPHFKLPISQEPHKQFTCFKPRASTRGILAYYEMWMGNFRFVRFQFKRRH